MFVIFARVRSAASTSQPFQALLAFPALPALSVPEMTSSREDHREAMFVCRGKHFRVAHRSTWLHYRCCTCGGHGVEAVAKWKERVGRSH